MSVRNLLLIFILLAGTSCSSEQRTTAYNLDFEYADAKRLPARWSVSDPGYFGYDSSLDTNRKRCGQQSLKLTQVDSTRVGWALFSQELPAELVAGREVELSGWICTQGIDGGFADLFLLENSGIDYDTLSLNMPDRGVRQTKDWTRVCIRKKCGADTPDLAFGGVIKGCGTAWFDGLELTLDGQKFADSLLSAPKTRLTRAEKTELRKYIYPLRSWDPEATDCDDLRVLDSLVGRAGVVALGENSHGSGEIYRMKDRMVRYLAANRGFDIFAIEANMPESSWVEAYTVEGRGDPKQLIAGMYFWIWQTHEMLDLVEWMRRFNTPQPRIRYTGIDMQMSQGPVAELKKTFPNEALVTKIASEMDSVLTYSSLGMPRVDPVAARSLASDLRQLDRRIETVRDERLRAWLRQQVVLLEQYLGQGKREWRDRCMAENVLWIRKQNPASRIVVWAHNGHIQNTKDKMGDCLKDSLGNDYVSFGFTFCDGSYNAICSGSDEWVQPAEKAYPGTLEYLLEQLDEPIFILDMKRMRQEHVAAVTWLDALKYRHVGAVKTRNDFSDYGVTADFDYLVFIRQSSPSHLFF